MPETDAPIYRSGAAARLAGIPVNTLRMWERRYGVVSPGVSQSGQRRYGAADVGRLAMIKSLVDAGHPIGTLAHLSVETLQQMRAAAGLATGGPDAATAAVRAPARVALVGEALAARADSPQRRAPRLHIVGVCAERERALTQLRGVRADVLAIELPTASIELLPWLDDLMAASGAQRAIIAYRFASETTVDRLRRRGHIVLRAPISLAEVALLAANSRTATPPATETPAPPQPQFDERALARLAQRSTTIACECPRHLVDLLLSLGAFERYSAECESRSPEDAQLHRHLSRVTGTARALLEEALSRLIEAEGLQDLEGRHVSTA